MSAGLRIRRANVADAGVLATIARGSPSAPQWTTAQFNDLLLSKDDAALTRAAWLAKQDDVAVGFAVASALRAVHPAEAELESIAVTPEHRQKGIGGGLLAAASAWAVAQKADRLRLEVRSGNGKALRFYTALGFLTTGTRRGYYTAPVEDAICMERVL